ncbi:hypothetical protein [Cloacibacterium caeni]|jgi:hypothetical protein|uniref:hypothetical protein n=1 Tax=Cloacibacterium caeni TaxID=2004710 RepID=UPI001BCD4177|nr:hypothetical protein [Cloacibacterium caeni]
MKKYFIIIILLINNVFIYSQTYLDNTPAKYFDSLIKNDFQNENLVSSNKIKKQIYIETIKNDTLFINQFDKYGKIIEEIKFENGKRNEKWIYDYKENNKSISVYRFQNNKILNEKPDIYLFQFDQRKNLIFQKNIYRIGVEMSYKYFYDSNINLIKREDYINNKLTNSYKYKFLNNQLIEYISRRHFLEGNKLKTIESEDVIYSYNKNKQCVLITAQSLGRKSFYNFKYLNEKLIEENYETYDNFDGNIKYTYENGLLTNMIQEIQNKGKGETKIFYDSKQRISRIETYNNGGLIFRNFLERKDKTKTLKQYFFDKYNFWTKMEIKQDEFLIKSYEYKIEFYD